MNIKVFLPVFFPSFCESSDKNGSIITLLDKNEYKFLLENNTRNNVGKAHPAANGPHNAVLEL